MTVAELIKALQAVSPDDLMVVVNGYEGGYTELKQVSLIDLKLNVNPESYYGPHDTPDDEDEPIDTTALLLPRY